MSGDVRTAGETALGAAGEGFAAETGPVSEPAKKKRHLGLWITLAVIVALALFGYAQYRATMRAVEEIRADADAIMAGANALGDEAATLDFEAMYAQLNDMRDHAAHMLETISSRRFDILSHVPAYGSDILTARKMLTIGIDLADRVALPVLDRLKSAPLAGVISDEGIDGSAIYDLVAFLENVIPVAKQDVASLRELDDFAIPLLADELSPLFEALEGADSLLDQGDDILTQVVSFVDSFIGEDNTGILPRVWPLIKPFVSSDPETIFNVVIPYLERYMSADESAQIETLLPYIRVLFGVDAMTAEVV